MLLSRCLVKKTSCPSWYSKYYSTNNTYENFSFEVKKVSSSSSARLGTIVTPHGHIETPNFVFCGTKATMKGITPAQLRETQAQIMLSNTYHLMLTPGPDIVERMGGLQKFSGWNGPMLTDSGGYQIFSMGHGSVSNEIKGKRMSATGENMHGQQQSLLKLDENGATFRSFVDGSVHELTPEKSIQIQRQLGADLIVVLDECTPFNVDRQYTEASMHRSHRWAVRSLQEFLRSNGPEGRHRGRQALYGIVQGGTYRDLRDESCAFVNGQDFFGTAIGGSLGARRQEMYDVVAYTRARVRDDRPVHLLGIGGVRDIFHGVRTGIDTFDCVHPTRMGRHGGALVMAAHWSEEPVSGEEDEEAALSGPARDVLLKRWQRISKNRASGLQYFAARTKQEQDAIVSYTRELPPAAAKSGTEEGPTLLESLTLCQAATADRPRKTKLPRRSASSGGRSHVRENVRLDKSRFRSDPRPIDASCGCYTCRNFSRAYLHHLFKVDETLGGTLTIIHNAYFMNRLMAAIREGIANDSLDEVERLFVHPDLANNNDVSLSEGIGA